MSGPLPIKRIHHLEIVAGNARQSATFYRRVLGFDQFAYRGPETGWPGRASYALRQGEIRFVLTTPLTHEDPLNVFLTLHGDSVKDIAFEVDDADAVFHEALARGATPLSPPASLADRHGEIRHAAIRTFGDTIHSFIARQGSGGVFLPGFEAQERPGGGTGLERIDHVVGNVEDRQMDRWAEFYERVFGLRPFVSYDDKEIFTEYSALRSKVMANEERTIMLPINEPAPGRRKSQIQEYIDYHVTAGVQHVALSTDDIIATVSALRDRGAEFLDVPDAYYDTVWERAGEIAEDRETIRRMKILVDRDEHGYLLQLFTQPLQDRPTLFLECIQRRGCWSFGRGNFKALFEAIERQQARRGNL